MDDETTHAKHRRGRLLTIEEKKYDERINVGERLKRIFDSGEKSERYRGGEIHRIQKR